MKDFSIIDTAGLAYQTVWRERGYLFRLAVAPILVKLVCFVFALAAGYEDNVLRLTLCLVPAYLAEGWMIAHFVRLIGLNQRWPFRPSGIEAEDRAQIMTRGRGILGGAIAYTLINVMIGGYMALMMKVIPFNLQPEDVPPQTALLGILMLAFSVFAFRLIWAHIPLALNVPVRRILTMLAGRGLTFRFFGVWAMCYIPAMAGLLMFVSILFAPFDPEAMPSAAEFGMIVVRVAFDTIKALLCTAGMALTFAYLMGRRG
jgi:hypothetical protein